MLYKPSPREHLKTNNQTQIKYTQYKIKNKQSYRNQYFKKLDLKISTFNSIPKFAIHPRLKKVEVFSHHYDKNLKKNIRYLIF